MSAFFGQWFQNPTFLAVLAAVLIPPIIEWLLRRRRRIIPWAAMLYLLDPERQKRIRLQDRILLFLRMFIVFLIVLALARPLIRPEDIVTVDRKERSVVMLFDATYSNAQRVRNLSAFGTAKRMASDVLRGLPEGVNITVAALGNSLKEVENWSADQAVVQEKIENLNISNGSAGMALGLKWVLKKVGEKPAGTVEVYIFSDLQKRTWTKGKSGEAGTPSLMEKLTENAKVFVARSGGKSASNLYVTDFEPLDKVLAEGVKTRFRVVVKVSNLEKGDRIKARMMLFVNGDKRGGVKTIDLGPEGAEVKLPCTFLTSGEKLVRVAVEGDDSPLDNERLYLAEVPRTMKVLILDDKGGLAANLRPSAYVQYAVGPPSPKGRDPVSAFDTKVADWEEAQKEDFSSYGAVILANMRELPEGLVSRLKFYVAEGGALLTFIGENADLYQYESRLFQDKDRVLAALPGEKTNVTGGVPQPLLKTVGPLGDVRISSYRPLARVSGNNLKRIVDLDGKPFVVESDYGRGKSVVVPLAPDLSWGHLPLSINYPVLIQDLLREMLGDPNRFVNLSVGDTFKEPVMMSTQHILLKRPDRSRVRLTPKPPRPGEELPRLEYADTDMQGLYYLDAPPGVLHRNRFVVNLNPDESDMTMLDEGEFKDQFSDRVLFLDPNSDVARLVSSMYTMKEFAGMIMFLVLLLLLTESFLAMRFGLRKV